MTKSEILEIKEHRPSNLPSGDWKYYQEWNNVLFLHWQVNFNELRKHVPSDLEIDLFEGKTWVSLVAFTMEKIRPRMLPSFAPVSNFNEINIRTYVKYKNKSGVYFLSIEGGNKLSCWVAKTLSGLPYRHSIINRQENHYRSKNSKHKDLFELKYKIGDKVNKKSQLDKWLTERYALFHASENYINEFDVHHIEWPIFEINLEGIEVNYPSFKKLFETSPNLCHFSPGVQVLAWGKRAHSIIEK